MKNPKRMRAASPCIQSYSDYTEILPAYRSNHQYNVREIFSSKKCFPHEIFNERFLEIQYLGKKTFLCAKNFRALY